jgi:hypothetical protein
LDIIGDVARDARLGTIEHALTMPVPAGGYSLLHSRFKRFFAILSLWLYARARHPSLMDHPCVEAHYRRKELHRPWPG